MINAVHRMESGTCSLQDSFVPLFTLEKLNRHCAIWVDVEGKACSLQDSVHIWLFSAPKVELHQRNSSFPLHNPPLKAEIGTSLVVT